MELIVVGLNHRTAPVALREQLALADCTLRIALEDLKGRCRASFCGSELSGQSFEDDNSRPQILVKLNEAVILSTCNRLELFGIVSGSGPTESSGGNGNVMPSPDGSELPGETVGGPTVGEAGWRTIERFLADLQGIPLAELRPHLYFMKGHEAISHLMRVATGLDSMILGEPQILGQVTKAHTDARAAGTAGPLLSHLFERATHAGKRARTETEIGRHTTSISHAAARLVKEKLGDLESCQLLIIGAGEMAEVATQALIAHGARQLSFINRTFARAEQLALKFAGVMPEQFKPQVLNWYHLPEALVNADVIVTATGAPHVVIHEDDVRPILPERNGRPLLLVDIAMPRDIEESVGELNSVQRYDIDHLKSTVDANMAQRRMAIPDVETIINDEAKIFEEWLHGRQVLPVLVELRRKAREIAEAEMSRQMRQWNGFSPEGQQKVSRMVHRIVNKLLHEPTVRLKAAAAAGNGLEYANAISELFDLDTGSNALEGGVEKDKHTIAESIDGER